MVTHKIKTYDLTVNRTEYKCICFTLSIIAFLSVLLLTISLVLLNLPNTRIQRIQEYNKNVQNWNLVDSKLFANKTFFYEVDNITRYMNVSSSHEGSYWPVRDDCHSHKDPPEGCLPTDTLYYVQKSVHIHSPAPVTFYFNDVHNLMANYTVSSFIETTKNAIDLECEHDLTLCNSLCIKEGGSWEGNRCIIPYYLQHLCFRVRMVNGTFVLDFGPHAKHQEPNDLRRAGCFYKENQWTPEYYSRLETSSFDVTIRYFTDPVISASYLTFGCSDDNTSNAKCFGINVDDQNFVGNILLGTSLTLLVLDFASAILFFYCRRSGLYPLSSNSNRNKIFMFGQQRGNPFQTTTKLDLSRSLMSSDPSNSPDTSNFLYNKYQNSFTSQFTGSYIPQPPRY